MHQVTAALIHQENRILIAQRARGKRFGWRWEFPGGKLRIGETPEECLRREIREELNLEIQVQEHFYTVEHCYSDFEVELISFWCSITGGSLQLNEHEQVRWVTTEELGQYDFVEADLKIIARLGREEMTMPP